MIRYKVLLGKGLAAESSRERAYEPFGFVEQSGTFHSSNSRIVDWRKIKCKRWGWTNARWRRTCGEKLRVGGWRVLRCTPVIFSRGWDRLASKQ